MGRAVVEAVRELLATFPADDPVPNVFPALSAAARRLSELMNAPTELSQYIALALIAATVR
jgi:hypothetical protein